MDNDSPFGALSHCWRVYGSNIYKKDLKNLTLMTQYETLSVGPNVVNAIVVPQIWLHQRATV